MAPKPKALKRQNKHFDIVPTSSYRHRQTLMADYLDKILGQGSERALGAILAIAEGRCAAPAELDTQLAAIEDPRLKAMCVARALPPDWPTRLAAYNLLMAYHQGKPRQQIEVTTEDKTKPQMDLTRLTQNEKLVLLDLLARAKPGEEKTVEGEVTRVTEGYEAEGDEF